MVLCLVTLTDLQTRRAGLSASAVFLFIYSRPVARLFGGGSSTPSRSLPFPFLPPLPFPSPFLPFPIPSPSISLHLSLPCLPSFPSPPLPPNALPFSPQWRLGGMGERYSSPSGERYSSPSGSGQRPAAKCILVQFKAQNLLISFSLTDLQQTLMQHFEFFFLTKLTQILFMVKFGCTHWLHIYDIMTLCWYCLWNKGVFFISFCVFRCR